MGTEHGSLDDRTYVEEVWVSNENRVTDFPVPPSTCVVMPETLLFQRATIPDAYSRLHAGLAPAHSLPRFASRVPRLPVSLVSQCGDADAGNVHTSQPNLQAARGLGGAQLQEKSRQLPAAESSRCALSVSVDDSQGSERTLRQMAYDLVHQLEHVQFTLRRSASRDFFTTATGVWSFRDGGVRSRAARDSCS